MTTELQIDAPENTTDIEKINVGERLKTKRVELGFDERRVANELKITIEQVRALEANNFSYFRSVTFSRGFLKSYCRLLELDAAIIIRAFDDEQMAVEPTIKPIDKVKRQTHLGDPIIVIISVVIIAVLIFLVFWWPATSSSDFDSPTKSEVAELVSPSDDSSSQNVESNDDVVSSEANADTAVVEDTKPEVNAIPESEPAIPTNSIADDSVVTGLSAETKAILEEAGVSPDDVVLATQKAEVADVPLVTNYTDDIVITFDADCWSEVRDSTGKILYSGVKSAGTKLELTGSAPYRVVLGFAKGVSSLEYKGEAFDFSSFTRQDLARFELK